MPKSLKFSRQTPEEIIKHLAHLLSYDTLYNLRVDPLRTHFYISEAVNKRRGKKGLSAKEKKYLEEVKNERPRTRRLAATKKRTKPKIRSVKKGRTVVLKGRVY